MQATYLLAAAATAFIGASPFFISPSSMRSMLMKQADGLAGLQRPGSGDNIDEPELNCLEHDTP
ncbi:MAG TPA: hypothetical protein VJ740_17920 [Hyphomicrobiaceae bacterium]|nr:hypothetical protein [Hyphomicrobiaceae bacterium]